MANQEVVFADGLICKEHVFKDGGIITKLSFKLDEFIPFLEKNQDAGWCNITVQKSKGGKLYGKLDTWKPNTQQAPQGQANQNPQAQQALQENGYQAQDQNAPATIDDDMGTIPF